MNESHIIHAVLQGDAEQYLLEVQYQPGGDARVISPESIADIQLVIDMTTKQQKNILKY